MMFKKFIRISRNSSLKRNFSLSRISKKNNPIFIISKRQKFIIVVVFLSLVLFWSEQLFGKSGVYVAIILPILTDLFIFWILAPDLKNKFYPQIFILPFLYSLSVSLFYFLVPARFLTRIIMTSFYAIGLYSLLLSVNIFIVSSVRTIALLSSARTVSFSVTLVSYFFLSNVVISLRLNIFLTLALIFCFTIPLVLYSLWTHVLDSNLFSRFLWISLLSVSLVETALALWFWPASPTIIALFLSSLFYIFIGLSQNWIDRRLFKAVMWEYVWVAVIVFIVFVTFSLRAS
ncbi:MAG: hypothetical protein HYT07_04115 [Candidatus Levybacteria bacterium]|nr:hypothetical protein [Candidatus Levybacteria bacterium]